MRLPLYNGSERLFIAVMRLDKLQKLRELIKDSPRLFESIVDTIELDGYIKELTEVVTDTKT